MIFEKIKFGCTSLVLFFCLTAGLVLRGQGIPSSPEEGDPTSPSEQETTGGRQVGEERHVTSSASRNRPGPQPLIAAIGGLNPPDGARGYVQVGVSVTESYDDNIRQSDNLKDAFTSFLPFINLERQGETSSTTFRYQGDGRIYNQNPELNFIGHRVGISQGFHRTRWSTNLSHDFSYTPDLFSALFTAQSGGVGGPGSNAGLFTRRNKQLSNRSGLELQYRSSLRTSLTLSGDYTDSRFQGNDFVGSSIVGFRAALSYRVSEKGTFSIFPDGQLMRFRAGLGSTNVYSLYTGYSYRQGRSVWVSLRGGPQYSDFNRDPNSLASSDLIIVQNGGGSLPPSSNTGFTGGVDVTYNRSRSSFGISYDRGVGPSGGFGGSAVNQNVSLSLSARMIKGWSSTLTGSYGQSRLFDLSNLVFKHGQAGVRLERSVGEWAGLFISYQFFRQATSLPGFSITRNVVSAGIRLSSPRHRIR